MKFSDGLNINPHQVGKALKGLKVPEGRDTLARHGYFIKFKNINSDLF